MWNFLDECPVWERALSIAAGGTFRQVVLSCISKQAEQVMKNKPVMAFFQDFVAGAVKERLKASR